MVVGTIGSGMVIVVTAMLTKDVERGTDRLYLQRHAAGLHGCMALAVE